MLVKDSDYFCNHSPTMQQRLAVIKTDLKKREERIKTHRDVYRNIFVTQKLTHRQRPVETTLALQNLFKFSAAPISAQFSNRQFSNFQVHKNFNEKIFLANLFFSDNSWYNVHNNPNFDKTAQMIYVIEI